MQPTAVKRDFLAPRDPLDNVDLVDPEVDPEMVDALDLLEVVDPKELPVPLALLDSLETLADRDLLDLPARTPNTALAHEETKQKVLYCFLYTVQYVFGQIPKTLSFFLKTRTNNIFQIFL